MPYYETTGLSDGVGSILPASIVSTFSGALDMRLNAESVPAAGGATMSFASDVSQINFALFKASQQMTLVMKSSGTPTNTFTLSSTVPFKWALGSGIPNPFTGGDFTHIVATTGTDGTLTARKNEDPTP